MQSRRMIACRARPSEIRNLDKLAHHFGLSRSDTMRVCFAEIGERYLKLSPRADFFIMGAAELDKFLNALHLRLEKMISPDDGG